MEQCIVMTMTKEEAKAILYVLNAGRNILEVSSNQRFDLIDMADEIADKLSVYDVE